MVETVISSPIVCASAQNNSPHRKTAFPEPGTSLKLPQNLECILTAHIEKLHFPNRVLFSGCVITQSPTLSIASLLIASHSVCNWLRHDSTDSVTWRVVSTQWIFLKTSTAACMPERRCNKLNHSNIAWRLFKSFSHFFSLCDTAFNMCAEHRIMKDVSATVS